MNTNPQQKSKFQSALGAFFSFPVSPRRQFRRLMFCLFGMLILIIFGHMYLFNRVASRNIFQSTVVSATTAPVINEKKLGDVLFRYEAKSKKRMEFQMNPIVVSDPSR